MRAEHQSANRGGARAGTPDTWQSVPCAVAGQRQLTANVLTTNELSPQARNVLRRWVLSERYDDDPAGAITATGSGCGDHFNNIGHPVGSPLT